MTCVNCVRYHQETSHGEQLISAVKTLLRQLIGQASGAAVLLLLLWCFLELQTHRTAGSYCPLQVVYFLDFFYSITALTQKALQVQKQF